MWAVGEQDELAVGLRRIKDDNVSGYVQQVVDEAEEVRRMIGHTCFFYATA